MSIHLVIPGKPFAKQRARTGRGFSYTPEQTVKAEARIKRAAKDAGVKPLEGPLKMNCRFIFEPPKSWSKKRRAEAMGTWKTTKPDRDNLEKLAADGLNEIAYADDSQIVTGTSEKLYGPEAMTIIEIAPAGRFAKI